MRAVAASAVVLAFLAGPGFAAPLTTAQAGSRVGQSATVEGVVAEVHTAHSGAETFIDLGATHPNQTFTGVIFANSMAAVGDVSGLLGKTVDITGTIKTFEGKPGIEITSRAQIKAK